MSIINHVNLIAPNELSDDELDMFQTSFRAVMKYIKYFNNQPKMEEMLKKDESFSNIEKSAFDVINACTESNIKAEEEKEGRVNMSNAILAMKEDARNEGLKEGIGIGREETIKMFMQKMRSKGMTDKMIAELVGD